MCARDVIGDLHSSSNCGGDACSNPETNLRTMFKANANLDKFYT